jgi:predicted esterase
VTWWARGEAFRRQRHIAITPGQYTIETGAFQHQVGADDQVFGRRIRYLERRTKSRHLIILLHGIGLDANDFVPYMRSTDGHTVAITSFGFNADEAANHSYEPISLETHAHLVNGVIQRLVRQNPGKNLVIVGFSIGADLILRIGDLWRRQGNTAPQLHGILLLDPNTDHSTMLISRGFAAMDLQNPLEEFKKLSQTPATLSEFQNISEYLYKISKKNPAQLQRHAKDWYEFWPDNDNYQKFLTLTTYLATTCPNIRVRFSEHFEQNFNRLRNASKNFQYEGGQFVFADGLLDVVDIDHFDLISDKFLVEQVTDLLRRPSPPTK